MRLSVVIPAFNEEKLLPICLVSVRAALAAVARPGLETEAIVVDNSSTDRTAEIARGHGAKVVFEPHRQIGRARNAGARAASGDWLLFIDADSQLRAGLLAETLDQIQSGRHVGGGSHIAIDRAPRAAHLAVRLWNMVSSRTGWAAGSFLFCRADAFEQIGGFSDDLYAGEEIDLSRRLKRWGRPRGLGFVILTREPHVSSGRKFYLYSQRDLLMHMIRCLFLAPWVLRSRRHLGFYYDGRR